LRDDREQHSTPRQCAGRGNARPACRCRGYRESRGADESNPMSSTRWHAGDRSQYCASADASVRMLTSLCQDSQAGWNAKIVCEKTELALRECASA
jgi:hypothetical protein